MAFKSTDSFLRFLTMGALGVRRVMENLSELGFEPIELERYSSSNKIWSTKIKRLRLPDLLCVRTGLRVEVKVKSDLTIKMSHAVNNPDRAWDAGLRDDDLIAFVASSDAHSVPQAAKVVNFFTTMSLRATQNGAKLGPPKSAGQGAERDLEWPSYVSSTDGTVVELLHTGSPGSAEGKLRLLCESEGGEKRSRTYSLKGKHPYLQAGDRFIGSASIIAGLPRSMSNVTSYLRNEYDPLIELSAASTIDRYAAIKSLPYRIELSERAGPLLVQLIASEPDPRVQMEAAASAGRLGIAIGIDHLRHVTLSEGNDAFRMEAVIILSELRTDVAASALLEVALAKSAPSEVRQAAVWGLGMSGHRRYELLTQFLADEDERVVLHAIAAFGSLADAGVIDGLASLLDDKNAQAASAASQALLTIGSDAALLSISAQVQNAERRTWALATLGQFDPLRVKALVNDTATIEAVAPLLRAFSEENWLSAGERSAVLSSLRGQGY